MDQSIQIFDTAFAESLSAAQQHIADLELALLAIGTDTSAEALRHEQTLRRRLNDAQKKVARDEGGRTEGSGDALHEWIVADDIYYDLENAKYRRREKSGEWQLIVGPALLATRPEGIMFNEEAIKRALKKLGRVVARAAYMEEVGPADILNMMDFSTVLPAKADRPYHWLFDILLRSLAGMDGEEGVRYIERWVTVRYNLIMLRKAGAYRMPALVLDNDDGGAGKNVFVERALTTLFGKRLVAGNMRVNELTGDFNDNLKGRAVAMINEVSFDKTDSERLKQILGSKTLRVNPKHQAVRQDDNTTAFILSGNSYGRTVKLTGTEIDRRYSVLLSDLRLKLLIAGHVELDAGSASFARDLDCVLDDVLAVLDDPSEVARWIGGMIARHGTATTIEPLHGHGYRTALEVQESALASFLSIVFTEAFQAVSVPDLYQEYRGYVREWGRERDELSQKAFCTAAKRFAQKRFPDLTMKKAGRKDVTSGAQANWLFADGTKTSRDNSLDEVRRHL